MASIPDNWLTFAWAGWSLRVPPDWRPLGVAGKAREGSVLLGEGHRERIRVQWLTPRRSLLGFNPGRWVRSQLRTMAGWGAIQDGGPSTEGFDETAWAPRGKRAHHWPGWCGWQEAAGLGLLVTFRTNEEAVQREVAERILPSLRARPAGEPTDWSLLEASFRTPAGMGLIGQQLNVGDLCIAVGGRSRRMLVRQIYPAEIALGRRTLENWLRYPPLQGVWRLRGEPTFREWSARVEGRECSGYMRTGVKRVKFPMHWLPGRTSMAACVVDEQRDRLLMAEWDQGGLGDESPVKEAIEAMNRLAPKGRE
jgi:hypothetical protein